jgi:hypothetical protein
LKEFGLEKKTIFVCVSGKINISWTFLELERRRRTQFFLGSDDFLPFLFKIGQHSAGNIFFFDYLLELKGAPTGFYNNFFATTTFNACIQ